jgi:hypothetical protein
MKLRKQLTKMVLALSIASPATAVTETKPNCQESDSCRQAKPKKAKIGVMLPADQVVAEQIRAGVEAGIRYYGPLPDRVVFYQKKNGESAATAFNNLTRVGGVALIVNGVAQDAAALDSYASRNAIPVFHAARIETSQLSQYSYSVFPNEDRLSATVAAYLSEKKIRRIGVLTRTDAVSSVFTRSLLRQLEENASHTVEVISYQGGDLSSMEQAAKKLLKIDPVLRKDEWDKIFADAQEKAEEENIPFQPEKLMLPAKVDYDLVLLPDDFRTVKHFMKIFKFFRAPKFPMMGNQQWRTKDLLNPPEPFLEGAVIVDYLPEQGRLPALLQQPEAMADDYQVIGFQSLSIALASITQIKTRAQIPPRIASLQNVGLFAEGAPFDAHRRSHWPAFLFQIRGGKIVPLNWRSPPTPPPVKVEGNYTSKFFPPTTP